MRTSAWIPPADSDAAEFLFCPERLLDEVEQTGSILHNDVRRHCAIALRHRIDGWSAAAAPADAPSCDDAFPRPTFPP